MKYDVHAEFSYNIKPEFEEWIKRKWKTVKRNKKIEWSKKPEELKKELEKDTKIFHKFIVKFLQNDEILCPILYAKLQKVFQNFVEIQRDKILDYIHSILRMEIKGYDFSKSPINKLNIEESSKNAYKKIISQFELTETLKLMGGLLKSSNSKTLGNKYLLFITIKFILEKPYLSKDDEDFYIMDNSIAKDKVFKVPYIRSTTWKGALRRVVEDITPEIVERLFGNEKEGEKSRQGRLFFYSTVLDRIRLDVITPLDRVKKAPVRGPILLEVAPEGSEGEFKLIYFPFDLTEKLSSEKEEDRQKAFDEIKKDLEVLKEAIPKMMLEYGFSAKKTSGYGVVEDEIEFWINDKHNQGTFDDFKREMDVIIRSFGGNNG